VNLLFRPREMYFDDRSVYVEETRLSAGFAAQRGRDISAASALWWQSFLICSRLAQRLRGKGLPATCNHPANGARPEFPIEIIGVPTVRERTGWR
jgi:hypothetical protein